MALGFSITQNLGQLTDLAGKPNLSVQFYSQAGEVQAFYEAKGVSYLFEEVEPMDSNSSRSLYRTDMQFVGHSEFVNMSGMEQISYENFLLAHTGPDGLNDVPVYNEIHYSKLYEGIDLFCQQRRLAEYRFEIEANANPNQIAMKWSEDNQLSLDAENNLTIRNLAGDIYYPLPSAIQIIDGIEVLIEVSYHIVSGSLLFSIGDYDTSLPLTILMKSIPNEDLPAPDAIWTIDWSTRIQGISATRKMTTYNHPLQGDILCVTGDANSVGLPNNIGQWTSYNGADDAFITCFSKYRQVLWSTYIGGTGQEQGWNIATNSAYYIYCIGVTKSTNFPTVQGTMPLADFQATNTTPAATGFHGFVVKLNANGKCNNGAFAPGTFSTYFGANSDNKMYALTIDASDNVYIGGAFINPTSTAGLGINLAGAYNTAFTLQGGSFLAKITAANDMTWRTAIGNWIGNEGFMVDVTNDASGNLYCIGTTTASGPIVPLTGPISSFANLTSFPLVKPFTTSPATVYNRTNGVNPSNGAPSRDFYIMKWNNTGQILWSTLFGGSGNDCGITNGLTDYNNAGISVDASGNVWIGGTVGNPIGWGSPVVYPPTLALAGAYNDATYNGGVTDGILLKFNTSLTLNWSSYYGTNVDDFIHGTAINAGNFSIAGEVIEFVGGVPTTGFPWLFNSGGGYSHFSNVYGGGITNAWTSGCLAHFSLGGNMLHSSYFSNGNNYIYDITTGPTNTYPSVMVCGMGYATVFSGSPGGVPLFLTSYYPNTYYYNFGANGGTVSNLLGCPNCRLGNLDKPQDDDISEDFTLYPNPNDGNFVVVNLHALPIKKMEVLNAMGQTVVEQSWEDLHASFSPELPCLAQGIYYMRIEHKKGQQILRFIVQ